MWFGEQRGEEGGECRWGILLGTFGGEECLVPFPFISCACSTGTKRERGGIELEVTETPAEDSCHIVWASSFLQFFLEGVGGGCASWAAGERLNVEGYELALGLRRSRVPVRVHETKRLQT